MPNQMPFAHFVFIAFAFLIANSVVIAHSQDISEQRLNALQGAVVVLDQQRLFSENIYSIQMREQLIALSEDISAENRQIEADLIAQEKRLSEARATLPPEEFKKQADEFNQTVQNVRQEREARINEMDTMVRNVQQKIQQISTPILNALIVEIGAVAVLDSQSTLYVNKTFDITDIALTRLNFVLEQDQKQ